MSAPARRMIGNALRNLYLTGMQRFGELQRVSEGFWRESTYTFLAPEKYYQDRAAVLSSVLDSLDRVDSVVDIGCGDGRFTQMLARHSRRTVGYDISPALIDAARRSLPGELADRVRYEVAGIDGIPQSGDTDLVSCMGVFSCLIQDEAWLRALDKCRSLTRPGGLLLLVDTLAERKEVVRAYRSGYVARYRRRSDYERAIVDRGMVIEAARPIARMSRRTVNLLYLVRR